MTKEKNIRVSCIVPAYNEAPRISAVLEVLSKIPDIDEIIVIDDHSSDNTIETVQKFPVKLIQNKKNLGKTLSVKRALEKAKGEIILLIDADLIDLTVGSVNKLLKPVLRGQADTTIGLMTGYPVATIFGIDRLSGQRALKRIILEDEYIWSKSQFCYSLELLMNEVILDHDFRFKIVKLPEVKFAYKMHKHGLIEGLKKELEFMQNQTKILPAKEMTAQFYKMWLINLKNQLEEKKKPKLKNFEPLISIIIPTKNEERHLPVLLDSIRKQNYENYEIIVSDNHSEDRTREIAKKYKCRVVDGGILSVGRNNGAKVAKGEFLLFLDADTVLFNRNTIRKIVDFFVEEEFDFCSATLKPDTKKKLDKMVFNLANLYCLGSQKIDPAGYGGYIFVRKEVHDAIGGFRDLMPFEDQDYVKRASKISKYKFLRKPSILVSTRRFEKEGTLKVTLKYLVLNVANISSKKIKNDIVEYDFDIYNKEKEPKKTKI